MKTLDKIIAVALMILALWMLFVVPAQAQPAPFAWLAELRSEDASMREYRVLLDRPWIGGDIRSQWFPQASTIKLIPVWEHPQKPLSDQQIAELWNVEKNVYAFARRLEAAHGINGVKP